MGLGIAYRDSLKQAGESLVAAREQASDARKLLGEKKDPLDAREQSRVAALEAETARKVEKARDRWTLARCARDYHEREIEPAAKPVHAAQWISSLENHVPAELWHAPIDSITAPALLEALQGVTSHERARNVSNLAETLRRIRQRLDTVFVDAIFHGRCVNNPAGVIGKKLGKARPKKAGEFAALPFEQAPALLARLRAMPGTAARCLEFAVLTTARTSEVLLAEWSEIDLAAGTHVVPAHRMKRGEQHTVHLSPRAVEILRTQMGQDARFVFPSTQKGHEGKPQSNMAMLKALERLGVRDQTTVHGLCRSTFSTWANETSAARPDVIEACLAHSETDLVRKAYNRAQFNQERRALLLAWADYLAKPALQVAA
jgi:integrase